MEKRLNAHDVYTNMNGLNTKLLKLKKASPGKLTEFFRKAISSEEYMKSHASALKIVEKRMGKPFASDLHLVEIKPETVEKLLGQTALEVLEKHGVSLVFEGEGDSLTGWHFSRDARHDKDVELKLDHNGFFSVDTIDKNGNIETKLFLPGSIRRKLTGNAPKAVLDANDAHGFLDKKTIEQFKKMVLPKR